jgi:hypothetical protein
MHTGLFWKENLRGGLGGACGSLPTTSVWGGLEISKFIGGEEVKNL